MNLTWEVAVAMITIAGALITALGYYIRSITNAAEGRRDEAAKRIEQNQTDIKDDLHTIKSDFEKRVDRLEMSNREFMPKNEIANRIEHEKNNRVAAQQGLNALVDRNTSEIVGLKVELGKLDSKHGGLASQVGELKTLINEQRRETNERLDKISDCVNTIAKKVG